MSRLGRSHDHLLKKMNIFKKINTVHKHLIMTSVYLPWAQQKERNGKRQNSRSKS